MTIDFGKVTFEGKTIHLTQEAFADNYGTDGGVRYYANGVDDDGIEYRVAWDTTEDWDEEQSAYRADPDGFVESIDESDACDWSNPVSVVAA